MTTTVKQTLLHILNLCNPNNLFDALRAVKLGRMLTPIKVVAASLTAADSFDITTAAFKTAATLTGITLDSGEMLPPIQHVNGLVRVVTGGATYVGVYAVAPVGATVLTAATAGVVGVCTLSDDGKTLTFPTNTQATAITFFYQPKAATDVSTAYPTSG